MKDEQERNKQAHPSKRAREKLVEQFQNDEHNQEKWYGIIQEEWNALSHNV